MDHREPEPAVCDTTFSQGQGAAPGGAGHGREPGALERPRAIAGQAGIGVLDGLGMPGGKMHTVEEFGYLDKIPQQIDFAAALLAAVCKETI